ncbi:MAG: hypothetical protein ACFFAO_12425 [Candidatus Hermodarchaeota archaeon]
MIEFLERFASFMESKYWEKFEEKRDSWQTCSLDYLRSQLTTHYIKWIDNYGEEKEPADLVDIAMFCMYIFLRLNPPYSNKEVNKNEN